MPPDAPGSYFEASLDGGRVAAVSSQNRPGPAEWVTYIAVDSADEAAERVRANGGTVTVEPFDIFEAGRMAACTDPEGAGFCLWEGRRTIGAEVVNVPGSWNFSALNSGDREAAQRFYGAVFGWTFTELDYGTTMVMVPGYADYLESIDPGVKKRHVEGGAPPGFSDCVAWLDDVKGDAARQLERHLHRRRCGCPRRPRHRARRNRPGRAVRRAVAADHRDPRPAGRDADAEPVQAARVGGRARRGERPRGGAAPPAGGRHGPGRCPYARCRTPPWLGPRPRATMDCMNSRSHNVRLSLLLVAGIHVDRRLQHLGEDRAHPSPTPGRRDALPGHHPLPEDRAASALGRPSGEGRPARPLLTPRRVTARPSG